MSISQIRTRIDALKRKFARELAIIQLRRIAESVADDWTSAAELPEPSDVIQRIVKAGFRLPTFARLHRYINDIRRKGEVPYPNTLVLSLLPWAGSDRDLPLLLSDLPALAS